MAAKKKTIEEVEGVAPEGATDVAAMVLPAARPEGRKLDGDPAAQAAALFTALRDEAKVL
jgi:electron transfer flavoprotein alpha/beta subunit